MDFDQLALTEVPILTAGLLETCSFMPEDPVEYMAEYLFEHANDMEVRPGLGCVFRGGGGIFKKKVKIPTKLATLGEGCSSNSEKSATC